MRQANQQHGSEPALSLRPWQRLSVKLACLLTAVTVCAVAAVGGLTYKRQAPSPTTSTARSSAPTASAGNASPAYT